MMYVPNLEIDIGEGDLSGTNVCLGTLSGLTQLDRGLRAQNQGWPLGIVTAQLLASRTSRSRAFGPALGIVARRKPSRPSPDSPIVLEREFGSREGSFERGEGGW